MFKTSQLSLKDLWLKNQERLLFLLAILFEFLLCFISIQQQLVPNTHDGFQYFTLQYYFLNGAAFSKEIPQWMPFMTQGTVATWWYCIQASLLQNIFLLIAPLLKTFNFITIFHLNIFVDHMILIIGVWLLGRLYFRSSLSIFFVTTTITGSSIWMLQPWYSLHLFYALPLIIYFLHMFLKNAQWRYSLLALNLLILQFLGNLPYFLPVISLVIFLYFIFYILFNIPDLKHFLSRLSWGPSFWLTISLTALSVYVLHTLMTFGTQSIVNYNIGRNLDGTTTLEGFLKYAGNLDLSKWPEMIIGISPAFDYTLFIGYLTIPLIFIGFFAACYKKHLHIVCLILVLFLISSGTPVASFFYDHWPLMKFFRHLALLTLVIKLFLCILAGLGLDYLLSTINSKHKDSGFMILFSISLLMIICGFLFFLSKNIDLTAYLVDHFITNNPFSPGLPRLFFEKKFISAQLSVSILFCLTTLFLTALLFFFRKSSPHFHVLILSLVAISVLHIYSTKLIQMNLRTFKADETASITTFTPMPYFYNRLIHETPYVERIAIMDKMKFPFVNYWSTLSFFFKDQLGSPYRTDHWLKPLDQYMKTYDGSPINDLSKPPQKWFPFQKLDFPIDHPACLKISGVTEEKVQFFQEAFVSNDETIAQLIRNPHYAGDILFIEQSAVHKEDLSVWNNSLPLNTSQRLLLPYEMKYFEANYLGFTVTVPDHKTAWVLYSDVWHPSWKASVNGKAKTVYKANLAYKAIQLEPGINKVEFSFYSKMIAVFQTWIGIVSMLWLCFLLWMTKRIIWN